MLRTTSICDRSALTARVEPPRTDCALKLWVLVLCHTVRASVRDTVRDRPMLPARGHPRALLHPLCQPEAAFGFSTRYCPWFAPAT